MRIPIVTMLLFSMVFPIGHSQNTVEFFNNTDAFFKEHVRDGMVDYKHIKSDTSKLNELLEQAKGMSIATEQANEYQAFWINGYNLLVIKGIVDNYPVKSPLDVNGFFDKNKHEIGGIHITLNDIENKLLREKFPDEPRFHFVLVCAGLGCPPIIDSAYKPATLDAQMQKQTEKALNDSDFIRVDKNKVKVSQLFEWYKGDFTKKGSSLVDFINRFRTEKLPEKAKVSYYNYDWRLNDTK